MWGGYEHFVYLPSLFRSPRAQTRDLTLFIPDSILEADCDRSLMEFKAGEQNYQVRTWKLFLPTLESIALVVVHSTYHDVCTYLRRI